MQNYPNESSFSIGQSFWMCVTPDKRFAIAVFLQGMYEYLIPMPSWTLAGTSNVKHLGVSSKGTQMFQSLNSQGVESFDTDWAWPAVEIKPHTSWSSGLYVLIAYEIDNQGNGVDEIGKKIDTGQFIYPYPPDSDAMSLLVARSQKPAMSNIAYIVPLATYHAYNVTGGGCFYGYPAMTSGEGPFLEQKQVSERRPGGGLGALIGDPPDPYDLKSPRQQAAHWDFKFVQWMANKDQNYFRCDFYTDKDLHTGALNLKLYQLIVSVGHHEYWSQKMYDNAMTFLGRKQLYTAPSTELQAPHLPGDSIQYGNYACFSGNTCYRPISWDIDKGIITRDAEHWPDFKEYELTGLSYGYGGGKWGDKGKYFGEWSNTQRPTYGYTVLTGCSSHWVFKNLGLQDGDTLGPNEFLVGYECDGLPPINPLMKPLAQSPVLTGFVDGSSNLATLGIQGDQPNARYQSGVTFNAGTTDWARVLTNATDVRQQARLAGITSNVLIVLQDRPD